MIVWESMNSSYQVIADSVLDEVGGRLKVLRHTSGARIISVENDDMNKVFAAAFSTPAWNSTGVAHILEHMVLNGSVKYPTKEPFVDLIKTSLKTFLNAFTFSDRTVYPVASENEKDFYNLVDVYLDAVFNPLLRKEVFAQEGWRYAHNEELGWHYAGVVFNEMKGALGGADRNFVRAIEQGLFPDTHYRYESGGDPGEIVNLKYEDLLKFHDDNYVPENGWFFFWGNDSLEKRLVALEPYLKTERKVSNVQLPKQKRYDKTQVVREKYALAVEEVAEGKHLSGVYWMGEEVKDYESVLMTTVVNHVLLGNSGSMLRKALMESGLGSGLVSEGFESGEYTHWVFGAGLRDVKEENLIQIEKLVLETLEMVVKTGVESDAIEAAVNSIEFGLREEDFSSMPKGLEMFLRGLNLWIKNYPSWDVFGYEQVWDKVKKSLSSEMICDWIKRNLIDNPHRVRVELIADNQLGTVREKAEKARIEQTVSTWSEDEKNQILAEQEVLAQWQATPDSVEALACLPKLAISDVEREVKRIPTEIHERDEYRQLYHPLATRGIGYVNLAFDVSRLPVELMGMLTIWADLLDELGTGNENYGQFSTRIDKVTGGVETKLITSANVDGESKAYFVLSGKALGNHKDDLMLVMEDMLFNLNWNDAKRVKEVVCEAIGDIESGLLHSGHSVVRTRLAAKLTVEGRRAEAWHGVEQLEFLRELVIRIEQDWSGVLENLREIGSLTIQRQKMIVDYSCEAEEREGWTSAIDGLIDKIALGEKVSNNEMLLLSSAIEMLTMETEVNYVGIAGKVEGVERMGAFNVIVAYIGMSYLWEKVRMIGGAYGAMLSYDPIRQIVYGTSYRDPRLLETWDVYEQIGKYLETINLSEGEIEQVAIGMLAENPISVANQGMTALMRYISGWDDGRRQMWRDEVMSVRREDFVSAVNIFGNWSDLVRGVLGSGRQVAGVKKRYPEAEVVKLK